MNLKVKPSAGARKTYLLIGAKNRKEIESIILDYIGVLGWAKASPMFVEGGKKEGMLVLAVNRSEVNSIRAAFEASPFRIKILRVSGTIKGVER